ncbi:hypothetical protein F4802DRAFT_597934 [Xylaria palmicola]|nr:hypothetical protein F4802DRAFT_597934 [Xylaria palmicola]
MHLGAKSASTSHKQYGAQPISWSLANPLAYWTPQFPMKLTRAPRRYRTLIKRISHSKLQKRYQGNPYRNLSSIGVWSNRIDDGTRETIEARVACLDLIDARLMYHDIRVSSMADRKHRAWLVVDIMTQKRGSFVNVQPIKTVFVRHEGPRSCLLRLIPTPSGRKLYFQSRPLSQRTPVAEGLPEELPEESPEELLTRAFDVFRTAAIIYVDQYLCKLRDLHQNTRGYHIQNCHPAPTIGSRF